MDYLADTVAMVLHISQTRPLGKKARQILTDADLGEHRIFISCITLMEVLYLSEKGRISIDLNRTIQFIRSVNNYQEVPITGRIISTAQTGDDVPELHDQMIVATAKYPRLPILTNDQVLWSSKHVQCIGG